MPPCRYDPRKKNGVYLRIRNPNATGTLFRSGNLRSMGARSEFLALCAARKFARKVARLGMYDPLIASHSNNSSAHSITSRQVIMSHSITPP
jgi:TATA-box binding protein (TBP) (component of TFIID and TFIIIB)